MKLMQSLKTHFKRTAKDMKGMTFKEKVDHLWTYYKEYAFVVIMVILILGGVIYSILTPVPTLVSSGSMVNVSLSLEGHNYLTDDFYRDVLGSPEGNVVLNTANYSGEATVDAVDASYQSYMGVNAKVEAKELDYMLLSEEGMSFYQDKQLFMDLRDLLPLEELQQMEQEGRLETAIRGDLDGADLLDRYEDGRFVFAITSAMNKQDLLNLYTQEKISFGGQTLTQEQLYQMHTEKSILFVSDEISEENELNLDGTIIHLFGFTQKLTGEDLLKLCEDGALAIVNPDFLETKESSWMTDDALYPIAIDLTGMAFAEDGIQTDMPVYLSFIANTPRVETCQKLWEHIKNWK